MKKILSIIITSLFPLFALSAGANLGGSIVRIRNAIDLIGPFLTALAALYFMWNVVKYTISDDGKKGDAKIGMIWGIVGLLVMISVPALVNVLRSTLGINAGSMPAVPTP